MTVAERTSVLVVGGGPAGATVATLLAQAGIDVTLLERDVFPRYHIGESLLPSILEIADLTGLRDKLEACGFVRKYGGYLAWGHERWGLDFTSLSSPYGFQVTRAKFDKLLLDHAKSQGVEVFEGVEVRAFNFDEERPRSATWRDAENRTGTIAFDFLVDASGREGLMAVHYNKNRRFLEAFQNVALWGYWEGAGRMEFAPPGSIANGSIDDGWIWAIPLHDGTTSVGVVQHKTSFKEKRQSLGSLENIYHTAIDECPLIKDLLGSAQLVSGLRAEQDYSYSAERLNGPGYVLVGDAACFIDPLLSTGVHLATHAAVLAAAGLASFFRGEVAEEEFLTFFERSYRQTYLRLAVVVSALYQLYDGKQTYFWKAQQLTQGDYDDSEALNQAFLYVVSGMEDRKDSSRVGRELELDRLTTRMPEEEAALTLLMHQAFNKVFFLSSLSSEGIGDRFYVKTTPRLGLAIAEESVR
jgi:flavin-dependent dehydrogenase